MLYDGGLAPLFRLVYSPDGKYLVLPVAGENGLRRRYPHDLAIDDRRQGLRPGPVECSLGLNLDQPLDGLLFA